jgi:hypothetical protein
MAGPQNVEGNEETPGLKGHDLDSHTPLWQHDNAWVRVPFGFLRSMYLERDLLIRIVCSPLTL